MKIMRTKKNILLVCLMLLISTILLAQPLPDSLVIKNLQTANETSKLQIQGLSKDVAALKQALQKQQQMGYDKFLLTSYYLDAAISSTNNLQSLVLKESYRNKIASLNNPASSDLGFNLEDEVNAALKPILDKTKKTNGQKIANVVGSLLQSGGKGIVSLFPAANVFTSIISVLGSIATQEKKVEKEDLDAFIKNIEKYFNQYERLHQANKQFNADMEKLKNRLRLQKDDIRFLLQDMIVSLDKTVKRNQLKNLTLEDLMLRYFDQRRIQELLAKTPAGTTIQYPQDAIKSCKEIANDIQRVYDEYAAIYTNNYKDIRSIMNDVKNSGIKLDQLKLNNTLKEVEILYNDSRNIDADNLRLKTLFERLETVIQQM